MRIRHQIDFGERRLAVRIVARATALDAELPAGFAVERCSGRNGDDLVKVLEVTQDKGAVRPRAGARDVKVVAPALGGKSAFTGRAGTAVWRHKISEGGIRPDEAATGGA